MKDVAYLFVIITWIAGVVLANGFWSTLLAFLLPPWAWYLVVESFMKMIGMIG